MHVQMYYPTQALEERREGSDSSAMRRLPNTLPPPGRRWSCFHVDFILVNWTRNQTQIHSTPSYLSDCLVGFGKYKLLFALKFALCLWADDPSFCAQFSSCKLGAQQCFLWPFHITSCLVSKLTLCPVLTVVGQVKNCCSDIHEHATLQRLPRCSHCHVATLILNFSTSPLHGSGFCIWVGFQKKKKIWVGFQKKKKKLIAKEQFSLSGKGRFQVSANDTGL